MFSLRLFGGATLEDAAGPVGGPAAQRHRIALLSLLAAASPRGLTRDKAMTSLWPERDDRHARNLLKQSVHVLRRALGEGAILSSGDDLRLDPTLLRCDLIEFHEAMATGDRPGAVRLYTGPFLDGFFLSDASEFERWADGERDRLRHAYARVLEELAEERATAGDHAAAVDCWRQLAVADPYSARVTLRLMEALDTAGDRAGALRQARLHTVLIEQEFDAGPNPEVVDLAERLKSSGGAAGRASAAPAARSDPPSDGEAAGTVSTAGEDRPAGTMAARQRPRPTQIANGRVRGGGRWRRAAVATVAGLVLVVAGLAWGDVLSRKPADIQRVAVLPMANLTGDPQQDYFVAGMHDALIAELAQIASLTVYSRQSVQRYQGSDLPLPAIARELGVDALIEGSVFRSGDSVRITVQLVRAQPEEHLWAGSHHGPLSHALTLQGEVARSIARSIRARIAPDVDARLGRVRPVDPRAQQAYVRGIYHLERASYAERMAEPDRLEELRTAVRALEDAVALDPAWATAHGKLALAYHWMASGYMGQFEDEFYPKSKAAALRALALDDSESQAHASLGFVLFAYEWDWDGAERAIRRALELDPNSHHWIYALYLQAAGRHDEAIRHFRQAEERSPLSEVLKLQVATAYSCAGRHDAAIAEARELRARVARTGRQGMVGDTVWVLGFVSRHRSVMGMHAEAIATAEQFVAVSDSSPGAQGALALAYALAGRRDEARPLADRLEARVRQAGGVWRPAHLYAALGDTDRALDMVEAAFVQRRTGMAPFRCTLTYRLLRDEPRMQALLRPVGFPEPVGGGTS